MARGTAKSTARRRRGVSYSKWGYIFVTPFIIAYLIFSFYPLLTTFIYSASNMKRTTSKFWGFDNKDVFYDRYLNLNDLYSDDFDNRTGVDSKSYKRLREYFDKYQNNADSLDPLNEDGVKAIVEYASFNDGEEKYSVETANAVKNAYDNKDFSLLMGEPYDELVTWFSGYKNETMMNMKALANIRTRLDAIVDSSASDEESSTESEDAMTEASFLESEAYTEFVASLDSTEFNPAQLALLDYLSGYLTSNLEGDYTVQSYFAAVSDGKISITDPSFYYTCYTLDKTKIDFAEEGAEDKINSNIPVSFLSDLESFLIENSWKDTINSLNSYSELDAYSKGEKDLHDSEEQLYADLKTLQAAGIINIVPLVRSGDEIVESDDYLSNKLLAYRRYIDTKYETSDVAIAAASQISAIKNFGELTSEGGSPERFADLGINIYAMISYDGTVDIEKYRQVKSTLGLADALSFASYERLDNERKQANIEKAKEQLDENNAQLADVKAAYEAAKATGDKKATQEAYEALRRVENGITEAKENISNPTGILSKVDSSRFYIFSGMENYRQIFNSKSRLDTVVGSFVNTAILWVIGFIPQIGLALLLSAWFTDKKIKLKGLNFMKAMMYLPNVITSVTIAVFFRKIFMYSSGGTSSASQLFLRNVLGIAKGYNFFESAWATRFIICFINFWMWYGNTMITLIAGITSISESLYESAQIDGANSYQTYTKITLPLLRPILLYTLVTSMIGGLQMFDIPQYINQNPPRINFNGTMIRSTRTVLMYINSMAFGTSSHKYVGIACATSVLLFITTTILSIIVFYIMRDKDAAAAKKLAKKGAKKNG
ncbi:MAG: ABC transporter permease subunit [Clostridiales bacterium]|nr:ABC transporter permease subunit [Clostridiales bacterium]